MSLDVQFHHFCKDNTCCLIQSAVTCVGVVKVIVHETYYLSHLLPLLTSLYLIACVVHVLHFKVEVWSTHSEAFLDKRALLAHFGHKCFYPSAKRSQVTVSGYECFVFADSKTPKQFSKLFLKK